MSTKPPPRFIQKQGLISWRTKGLRPKHCYLASKLIRRQEVAHLMWFGSVGDCAWSVSICLHFAIIIQSSFLLKKNKRWERSRQTAQSVILMLECVRKSASRLLTWTFFFTKVLNKKKNVDMGWIRYRYVALDWISLCRCFCFSPTRVFIRAFNTGTGCSLTISAGREIKVARLCWGYEK